MFLMGLNVLPIILRNCDQVSLILNDATLFEEWKENIKTMSGRIIQMRKELHRLLTEELHTPGNWDHIVNQIGMFRYSFFFKMWYAEKETDKIYSSFTGISNEQSQWLVEKEHIYLTLNGRISMAGLNSHNIEQFARALDSVVRQWRHDTITDETRIQDKPVKYSWASFVSPTLPRVLSNHITSKGCRTILLL